MKNHPQNKTNRQLQITIEKSDLKHPATISVLKQSQCILTYMHHNSHAKCSTVQTKFYLHCRYFTISAENRNRQVGLLSCGLIELLKAYSSVNRTGSSQGFSLVLHITQVNSQTKVILTSVSTVKLPKIVFLILPLCTIAQKAKTWYMHR